MENPRIIAIGDNVCDKYLSRHKMYPGGQCVNICVYASENGAQSAYLGKFGDDDVARCVQCALDEFHIDDSHSRHFCGENGFACVTLNGTDRVFLGSNKGGVAKDHRFDFADADLSYIRTFDLICSNLNAYIERDLDCLESTGVPIAFDFSNRWTDEYLAQVCPHIAIAVLSCAHLSDAERVREMSKAADYGADIVLGTIGEQGSWLMYQGDLMYQEACLNDDVVDAMGAGDAYSAAFFTKLLQQVPRGVALGNLSNPHTVLARAMRQGAQFSSRMCCLEGAFGHGVPISGRVLELQS